jgi:hypothetical protein
MCAIAFTVQPATRINLPVLQLFIIIQDGLKSKPVLLLLECHSTYGVASGLSVAIMSHIAAE